MGRYVNEVIGMYIVIIVSIGHNHQPGDNNRVIKSRVVNLLLLSTYLQLGMQLGDDSLKLRLLLHQRNLHSLNVFDSTPCHNYLELRYLSPTSYPISRGVDSTIQFDKIGRTCE